MVKGVKLIAENRRARHDHQLLDRFEAGLVLTGSEVKSLREGRASLRRSSPSTCRYSTFSVSATTVSRFAQRSVLPTPLSELGAKGTPLAVRSPPGKKQYGNPIIWGWRCKADSDPAPQLLTIRWESDPRNLPLFSRGGKPPYKFSRRAKTIKVPTADPCDGHQVGGFTKKRLAKNATLSVILGGNATSGAGGLLVNFGGEFRNGRRGNVHPLHLGITLRQGSRTLVNTKVCAWDQLGFEIAKGKGVSCWW